MAIKKSVFSEYVKERELNISNTPTPNAYKSKYSQNRVFDEPENSQKNGIQTEHAT